MKNFKNTTRTLFVALVALFATSCNIKNDDPLPIVDNSILGVIKNNPNLSTFNEAIKIAGLVDGPSVIAPTTPPTVPATEPVYLNGKVAYTVFAPTNDAFVSFLAANNFASLSVVPVATLRQVLLNHLVARAIVTSNSSGFTGYSKTLAFGPAPSYNKLSLFINNTSYLASSNPIPGGTPSPIAGGSVKVNGDATIIQADITTTGGTLQIIDKVLSPPTIVTHAAANPMLSSLYTAVSSPSQSTVLTALQGNGPFTVFAPDNNAFTAFATEVTPFNPTGTGMISSSNLTRVLNYHVSNGNVLRAGLSIGLVINTLQTPQTVLVQSGFTLKDQANRVSTITAFDVQCTNGVVHVVNKVLLPN